MKKILLILTIIIFVILLNFRFYVFNLKFYENEFEKNGIYEKFPKNIVLENTNNLISYLRSDKPIDTDFFNEKEKLHLIDVKHLINKAIIIFYLSILLLLSLLYLNKNQLPIPILYSGISLSLIPILLSLFNFQFIFIKFHTILFNNKLWILNPATDNLINLFPQQFFIDVTKKIFINSLIIGLILVIIGLYTLKLKRRSND